MDLATLLDSPVPGLDSQNVTGFAIDHRKVAPGTVFGAFHGSRFNGEDFIPAAIAAGAIAVVTRPGVPVEGAFAVYADEPRRRFALLAGQFFAPFPATTVAVTGTNGKTSTVELTRQLWHMAGHHAASIGTLGVTTAGETVKTGLTTPDIVTFLSNMAGLAREGVTHAAFEASSHGLDQYRTEGLPVRAAGFTNLSRDHLDYHGDMAAYLTAKLRLFSEVVDADGTAVVWQDDEASDRAIDLAHARGLKLIGVGARGATLRLTGRSPSQLGQTLTVVYRMLTLLTLIGPGPTVTGCTFTAVVDASPPPPHPATASRSAIDARIARSRTLAVLSFIEFLRLSFLAAAVAAGKPVRKTNACVRSIARPGPVRERPGADDRRACWRPLRCIDRNIHPAPA